VALSAAAGWGQGNFDSFGSAIPSNWWTEHDVPLPPDTWVHEGTVSRISEALDRIYFGRDYVLSPDVEIHNISHWEGWGEPGQFDGRLLTIEEFEELEENQEVPDGVTLYGLPTVDREVLVTRIEFGHADHSSLSPEEQTRALHANYLDLVEDGQGRTILRTWWNNWELAFDVGDEYGDPLIDFDGTILQPEKFPQPGDLARILVKNNVAIRLVRNPPPRVWPGQEEPEPGSNVSIEDWRVGKVDPESRFLWFADRAVQVTEKTQFFDSFGLPFTLEELGAVLKPGIVLQVEGPHQGAWGHGAEGLEIVAHRDVEWPERPVSRYLFDSYDAEKGLVYTIHPWERVVAIGAPIVDLETNEELGLEDVEPGTPVRATHQWPGPGEDFPFHNLIIRMELNPEVGGGEVYHEWEHHGRIARIEAGFFGAELVFTGNVVRVDERTEILDRDGWGIDLEDLPLGEQVFLEVVPTSEPGVALARRVELWNHDQQYEHDWEAGLFGDQIDRIEGDRIFMRGNQWALAEGVEVVDEMGNPLELEDLVGGEYAAARVQDTSTGQFITSIRLMEEDIHSQPFWEEDREFFGFDQRRSRLLFAGPQARVIPPPRGKILGRHGEDISLDDVRRELERDPQTQLIVDTRTSQTGEVVAISVRIYNHELPWEEQVPPDVFVGQVAGFDGEFLQMMDGWQPNVAYDAEIVRGDGSPVALNQIQPGTPIRIHLVRPPNGIQTPFWDVVTRIEVEPRMEPPPGPGPEPGEPGEFEARVLDVDEGERTLTLEGPMVRLDPFRTEVLDQDRQRIDPSELEEGDLLAANFVHDWPHPRATRILRLDPDQVLQPRPDVLSGRLLVYDEFEELIILEGPTLSVPEGTPIYGPQKERFDLGDIASGDQVRLAVHEGPEGTIVDRVRLVGGFEGPIFGGGGLEITSTFPAPEESGVSTATVVEVTFNEPVIGLLADEDFDFGIIPEPPEFSDLDVSRDGRTILADVQLEEDTVYQLFVASERFGFFIMNFTTGDEMPGGEILGRLDLPEDVPFEVIALEESGVFLIDASVDLEELEDEEEAFVRGTPFEPTGEYHFKNIADGEYFVFADVVLEFGFGEQIELFAFYDADGDGEPDPVTVAGDLVDRVDLTVLPPEPMVVEETYPEDGETEVELETTIEVSFSEALRVKRNGNLAMSARIFPRPLSGRIKRENLILSEDGYTVSLAVELEENTTYSLLIMTAESEDGLELEAPKVIVFTTDDALPGGVVEGNLSLPDILPPDRAIRTPAVVALIPFTDFDPLDPDVGRLAAAGALTADGFYSFEHVPSGRYVVTGFVDVALPPFFRMPSRGLRPDFAVFERRGPFGQEAPSDFVDVSFFGFSQDETGHARADVRPDIDGVDFLLRPEDVRRVALRVVGVDPPGEELQEAPEVLDLAIEFSEALIVKRDFVELDAFLRPEPLSGPIMKDFDIEEGGKVVVFRDVELEPGTGYRFSVTFARGVSGQDLAEPFNLPIRTVGAEELVLGSVSGAVTVEGDEISEAAVFLYDPEAEGLEILAGGLVEEDDSYRVEEVVVGEYAAYVEIKTVGGDDLLLFYDADGDGEQDVFEVGEGTTEGIDFAVTVEAEEEVPEGEVVQLSFETELDLEDEEAVDAFKDDFVAELAATLGIDPERIYIVELIEGSVKVVFVIAETDDAAEPSASEAAQSLNQLVTDDSQALAGLGEVLGIETEAEEIEIPTQVGPNAAATVSLDLDQTAGDQGQIKFEVEAEDVVELGFYGKDLTDVTGVSVLVSFDTTQVAFVEAVEASGDETHLLKSQAGAIALFLPARLRENTVEFGGAILSPTENTAGDGDGLLGVLRFATLENYTGASLTLDRVIFNSLAGIQDTVTTTITALVAPPIDLLAQPKGIFSFDFNTASGDQELYHKGLVAAGDEVNVEIYINDVEDLTNYSVKLLYDSEQLSYVTFVEGDFLALGGGNALGMPPLLTEKTIEVGSAILGPTAAVAATGSGYVGTVTFAATNAFTETDLLIVQYSTKEFGGEQAAVESSIFARLSTEAISTAGEPTADFNGDGQVDFTDFFLFADAFGATDPDPRFDLNRDSAVDFTDFFIFADAFGQSAAKALVEPSLPQEAGLLALEAVSEEEVLKVQLRAQEIPLRGYGAVVEYDPTAFGLVDVDDGQSALRAAAAEALLLTQEGDGQVLIAGSRTGGAPAVEGLLAELRFAPLTPEASGWFTVREALVRQADGQRVQPHHLGAIKARWVPQVFALQPNYPNPFNPSTTLRYQLPVDSQVRLDIFDVLGQKVRTLVAGARPAGYHRVVWNSRDDGGMPVASGVYFSRLQAGDYLKVRKLLLLK